MGDGLDVIGVPREAQIESPRTVLVFGGSFDPPHRAHRELALRARDAIGADWLVFVPAGRSPHKAAPTQAEGRHRVGMVRAALKDEPRCSVSEIEVSAPIGPSYTVTTLRAMRASLPASSKLRLLLGSDQALALPRWREPEAILELAPPVVLLRGGAPAGAEECAHRLAAMPLRGNVDASEWRARIVPVPLVDVSSTRVRALLRHGTDREARKALRRLVDQPVLDYIEQHRLYRDVPGA